jgi:hypothetical protein
MHDLLALGSRPWNLGTKDHCWPRLFGAGGSVRAGLGALSRCANIIRPGRGPAFQRACPRVLPRIPHSCEPQPARP